MLIERIKSIVRDVPDFPKPGIIFKDITPILQDSAICKEILSAMVNQVKGLKIDVVAGIESRGFLFGMLLAQELRVPFVPIRKSGKLPYSKIFQTYELEYGISTIEMHVDALMAGQNVLIHDDLLATGGTVLAASELVKKLKGEVEGFSFLISLDFLGGAGRLSKHSSNIFSVVQY